MSLSTSPLTQELIVGTNVGIMRRYNVNTLELISSKYSIAGNGTGCGYGV